MSRARPGPVRASAEVVEMLRRAGCVYAEDEAALLLEAAGSGPGASRVLARLVAERAGGTPLEVLLGWADFDGLRVRLTPGVFVPRQRTRLLVDLAERAAAPGAVVVDLCCGSGAIGAALLRRRPDLDLYAADVDPDAVACARVNLDPARVHQGDLLEALPTDLRARIRARIDVLVVNAPYVPSQAIALMPPEARDHEHRLALDGGPDGLDVHRRVAGSAASWLAPGGMLLVEVAPAQVRSALALMNDAGLVAEVIEDAELEATAVCGLRPG